MKGNQSGKDKKRKKMKYERQLKWEGLKCRLRDWKSQVWNKVGPWADQDFSGLGNLVMSINGSAS